MKICTKCKINKDLSEYRKQLRGYLGVKAECKICECIRARVWRKTKDGVVSTIYNNQKAHSKKRGHRPPDYTAQELKEWIYSQTIFHVLYNEWVNSGYKKRLIPSIDRFMDTVHYCFGNIHIITWEENNTKPNLGTFQNGYDKRRHFKKS